jgi:hypothetical protein
LVRELAWGERRVARHEHVVGQARFVGHAERDGHVGVLADFARRGESTATTHQSEILSFSTTFIAGASTCQWASLAG